MDTPLHYLSLAEDGAPRADTRSQQIGRLMNGTQPQALADPTNRLERSVQ